MEIEIITHYAKEDKTCKGDCYEIDAIIDGRVVTDEGSYQAIKLNAYSISTSWPYPIIKMVHIQIADWEP